MFLKKQHDRISKDAATDLTETNLEQGKTALQGPLNLATTATFLFCLQI